MRLWMQGVFSAVWRRVPLRAVPVMIPIMAASLWCAKPWVSRPWNATGRDSMDFSSLRVKESQISCRQSSRRLVPSRRPEFQ